MPTIRIPQAAQPFLPLCRRHDALRGESPERPCFETYADLMVFVASLGFAEMGGSPPMNRKETPFLDRPNPIDLAIFKNDRRYPQLLLIALAASGDRNVVRDEDLICKLTEDFAIVGCERLKRLVDQGSPGSWHLAIASRLAALPPDPEEIKI